MALASVANALARAGSRVLITDFDLEAPGIEQYFPVDQSSVRTHLGLFDLVQRYKRAMAASSDRRSGDEGFRRVQDFILSVYPQLPSDGLLDLMPAGQRGSDEQLARYALELRQFDWQDFYFNWGGEFFFEWLRRTLTNKLYDVVLVDSRTGVTEMGGICAYQLADIVVMFCAPNRQNLEGTHNIVKNFMSSRVRMLRLGRNLHVLVVPARVETQDPKLLETFRRRFEELFQPFAPAELGAEHILLWDLLIPYDPARAFDEEIASEPLGRPDRSSIWDATRRLTDTLLLLSGSIDTDDSKPAKALQLGSRSAPALEAGSIAPQYDITQRFAGYDALVDCAPADSAIVRRIVEDLAYKGLAVYIDSIEFTDPANGRHDELLRAVRQSRAYVVCVGPYGEYPWASEYRRAQMELAASLGIPIIPVLLPGGVLPDRDRMPLLLAHLRWVRIEQVGDSPAFEELRRTIEQQTNPSALHEQKLTIGRPPGPADPGAIPQDRPPFKGLEPFREEDAAFFFGRERLVRLLVDRLRDKQFMAIVGPSGSGKSSVVRAGLIPALRSDALPGSAGWHYLIMRPGAQPMRSLVDVFGGILGARLSSSATEWEEIERLLPALPDFRGVLLVVDQFEEAFTLGTRDSARWFIAQLLQIVANPDLPITIVIVLRSDFMTEVIEFPEAAHLIEDNLVLVPAPSVEELRAAIVEPARLAGLALEPGLVDRILQDVANQPGALPLLQYLLLSLWEHRRQGFLTVEGYDKINGVAGAVERSAEGFYAALEPSEQALAEQIFVRLVAVEGSHTIVRRRTAVSVLAGFGDAGQIMRLVDQMTKARLVVRGAERGEDFVELAHERLIQAWPRFAKWVEDNREWLRVQARLRTALMDWEVNGRPKDLLWAGSILDSALWRLKSRWADLAPEEAQFITASERARTRRRRLTRASIASLATLTLATIGLGVVGWQRAEQARVASLEARLAAEQVSKANQQAALANASASFSISPDGRELVMASGPDRAELISLDTGKVLGSFSGSSEFTASAFSPDGKWIFLGDMAGRIRLFDATTTQLVTALTGHTAAVLKLSPSPDGRQLASVSRDRTCRVWMLPSGIESVVFEASTPLVNVAFSPNGAVVIALGSNGTNYILDAKTGRPLSNEIRG